MDIIGVLFGQLKMDEQLLKAFKLALLLLPEQASLLQQAGEGDAHTKSEHKKLVASVLRRHKMVSSALAHTLRLQTPNDRWALLSR